jgi:hypothetical protein
MPHLLRQRSSGSGFRAAPFGRGRDGKSGIQHALRQRRHEFDAFGAGHRMPPRDLGQSASATQTQIGFRVDKTDRDARSFDFHAHYWIF